MTFRFATTAAFLPLLTALAACQQQPDGADAPAQLPMYQSPGSPGSEPAGDDAPGAEDGAGPGSADPSGNDPNGNDPSGNDPNGNGNGSEQIEPGGLVPSGDDPTGDVGGDDAAGDDDAEPVDDGSADDGDPLAPAPGASSGCGRAQGVPANVNVPNAIVTFPPAYDGSTPLPLVFGFHGAGRTNEDQRLVDSRTAGGALEATYVMAYVKSAGNGWDVGADAGRFEAVLSQMLDQFCIDTDALFAFGHSSGAQFIVQLLGDNRTRETRFAGVVPVASSRYFNPAWSPVPTLVIHGLNDNQRGGDASGASDIVQYVESNQCSGDTRPFNAPGCSSLQGGVAVSPGCVEYAGCAAPTVFCNHDDPNYENTNHGWPCFANAEMLRFFESLR